MNLNASNIGRRSSKAVSWKSENHDEMGTALSRENKKFLFGIIYCVTGISGMGIFKI